MPQVTGHQINFGSFAFFQTLFHALKSQTAHRFASNFRRVQPATSRGNFNLLTMGRANSECKRNDLVRV